ncbi:MAG TPA: hypothetical protein VGB37_09750 [Candidatus Lokiarchaeia archaeon]
MGNLFKSTLDIDSTDKELLRSIFLKIAQCNYLIDIETKPSDSKGYHFILRCFIKCDICRLCYDDFKRFAFDQKRPEWARNILFDVKEYV